MRQRQAITKELKARYNKATKKEKAKILDEFAALTDTIAAMHLVF
ncbi:MAG: hypothetical protein ACYDIA_02865 [Candidatus Humimicrobiaceae bacterium]